MSCVASTTVIELLVTTSVQGDIMLVLHCSIETLMEVKNGVEDEGLRLETEEENQEKKSLGTAQRQKYTVGRPNARSKPPGGGPLAPGGFAIRGKQLGGISVTPGGCLLGLGQFSVTLLNYK
ncbi:hypothetical protein V8G54_012718 [Vigna mungo]|uniref:Uncharacterized protein n=1 Tax=Vigna mungo TaxID=3915 RepID=A0AAQ3S2M1_VIGMU